MKKLLIGIVTFFVLLVECVAIFGLFNDDEGKLKEVIK